MSNVCLCLCFVYVLHIILLYGTLKLLTLLPRNQLS